MPLNLQAKLDLVKSDPYYTVTSTALNGGPEPEDEFLYGRLGSDYQEYLRMRRDPHIRSRLNKRKQAVLGRRVIIEPATSRRADRKAAGIAEQIHDHIYYEDLCSKLMGSGQLIGWSVLQLDWIEQDGLVLPRPRFIAQNRFAFIPHEPDRRDIDTATGEALDPESEIIVLGGYELRLLTKQQPYSGVRCPKGRFIVYSFDAEQSPLGLGLGYSIYPWWKIKTEARKAWLLHSDRLGSPPVWGTTAEEFDADASQENADVAAQFDRYLQAIAPNGWGRFPAGFQAELLEAVNSSSPDVHERLIKTADEQISEAILGDIQFSEKDRGSYAANDSQVEDREVSLTDADCNTLDEQLQEQLWRPIAELNYPGANHPIIRRETTSDREKKKEDQKRQDALKTRAERDLILIRDLQMKPSEDYIRSTYGEEWTLPNATPTANNMDDLPEEGGLVEMGEGSKEDVHPNTEDADHAEPIALEGETDLLSDDEWDDIADDVGSADSVREALEDWKERSPDRFNKILEAGSDE